MTLAALGVVYGDIDTRPLWTMAQVAWGATLFFVVLDLLRVSDCIIQLFDGGWFPLAVGTLLFLSMSTWSQGRARRATAQQEQQPGPASMQCHRARAVS